MSAARLRFFFLNLGHFVDHLFMLIFAKAAYDAGKSWGLGYDEMIIYGTPAAILFGACAPLAAHAADKYGRNLDRKSTRLNSSHSQQSRMPSSA